MNILIEEHKQFILDLLEHHVEFILVGGYAVIYHGYGRTTGDMDIWLKPDNFNKEKLLALLKKYEFLEEDIFYLQQSDFTQAIAFHFGDAPKRIDFMTKMAGLNFDEAQSRNQFFTLKEKQIPVLHLDALIVNKMYSNRLKDKADIEELQKILKAKNKN